MKTLMAFALVIAAAGCSKDDPTKLDPCERAAENVRRLHDNERAGVANAEDHVSPLTLERCRAASLSKDQLHCLQYASSYGEARECNPRAFEPVRDVARQ